MQLNQVDMFVATNAKYFKASDMNVIRQRLLESDDSKTNTLLATEFKDPTTSLIVSIFAGQLGIDRFLIGDSGIGLAKLLTCGGMGIWGIIDWFKIQDATKDKNMELIRKLLY
jgi:TM2 domain-containing membrane protein YozV